jgi:hypothetical protein
MRLLGRLCLPPQHLPHLLHASYGASSCVYHRVAVGAYGYEITYRIGGVPIAYLGKRNEMMNVDETLYLRAIALTERHPACRTPTTLLKYARVARTPVSLKPVHWYTSCGALPVTGSVQNLLGRNGCLRARHGTPQNDT